MGTAREVAEVVRFLAGDGAAYITGQVIHVNGGCTCRQRRSARRRSAARGSSLDDLIRREEVFMAKPVEERVKEIICEQLGVEEDEVNPNAKFIEDLGADSLDTVELVMAFEEEFDLEIPDEDAEKIATVGDAIRYIKENQ